MKIINLKPINEFVKPIQMGDKSPLKQLIMIIEMYEKSFGLNVSISLDQEIRHCNLRHVARMFNEIKKLENHGFIKIISNDFKHYRPEYTKNDNEWDEIDRKINHLANKGKINLI